MRSYIQTEQEVNAGQRQGWGPIAPIPLAPATHACHPCLHLPEQAGVNETLTFLSGAGGVRTSLSSGMVRWPDLGAKRG